jgi:tRNA pseudouridine38-40 synthase
LIFGTLEGENRVTSYLGRLFYVGTSYHGSQWQPNVPTVQGELARALTAWSGYKYTPDTLLFSGRTDKGVSSLGQIISFDSAEEPNLDAINSKLPDDIVLWAFCKSSPEFNSRFGVLSRHYRYYLDTNMMNLDIQRIRNAANRLVGTHDFRLLSKPDNGRSTIATILNTSIATRTDTLVLDMYGTNFVWKLVRKTIALLKMIGMGQYPPEIVTDLLQGHNPIHGGIKPSPPEGLVLVEAIVPFQMKISKNAVRLVHKKTESLLQAHRRAFRMLNGITQDYLTTGRWTL